MSEVDAVIDRLRREIGDLDDELARVRQASSALAATAVLGRGRAEPDDAAPEPERA